MASAYANWTLAYTRSLIRRELMDPTGRWWTDAELNQYINDWQNELQRDYELVWGTATLTTAVNTLTLSNVSPPMMRLDAVYFIGTSSGDRGYRLAGRSLQDLEVSNIEWRNATSDTPREVIQYDSTQIIVWPPLITTGTFVFEYPQALSIVGDANTISLPVWTQWSVKSYVASKAYLRPGPTNDLKRALRYRAQYEREKSRIKLLWDNWLPERYRRLKPGCQYEWNILIPPPAIAGQVSTGIPANYKSFYFPLTDTSGIVTLPIIPTDQKVFWNGLLQTKITDYSISGSTITLNTSPTVGDSVVVWTYQAGG